MEELILKLTQAINDFNKYLKNEYSSINKNFSGISNSLADYSVFKIVTPKLTDYKINKIFPRANYIMVKINNNSDTIYLAVNSKTKDKLQFRDGSYYKGILSDLYLTYDFSAYGVLPNVEIFIGYNAEYLPIQSVKISSIDTDIPLVVNNKSYAYKTIGVKDNVNNSIKTINLLNLLTGYNVLGISSVIITNLDNSQCLYFGDIDNISNIDTCKEIGAGESFGIDFNPNALNLIFTLASLSSVDFQIQILFNYGA